MAYSQQPGGPNRGPSRQGKKQRKWLMPALVATFIAVPLAEVWLLVQTGQAIGVWPTIGLLILMALLGSWLSKREGSRAWRALQDSLHNGRMPQGELADAALVLVGAVMLIFPGFFTDIFGLFFLIPVTRPIASKLLSKVIGASMKNYSVGTLGFGQPDAYGQPSGQPRHRSTSEEVIEGEVIEGDVIHPDEGPGR